ncbi:hypothetical protein [Runella sp.]|jgi:hypothetical protein|uniref:hypothetical protein n=1 Tax=Runella sp. TaxID=1960881 RepID=UPI003017DF35
MTQVTLTLQESKQAEALLHYLESLDFVKVERNITPLMQEIVEGVKEAKQIVKGQKKGYTLEEILSES